MVDNPLLNIQNLKKYFPVKKGFFRQGTSYVKAVDDISFKIEGGETLGLVGESGCGKTTTGKSILRLIEPTSGIVEFNGINVTELNSSKLRKIRKEMQIIFQDPYASLNPRMTVGKLIAEPLKFHNLVDKSKLEAKVADILENVGLSAGYINRYPHEFSGGQRQRIGIARALAVEPRLIIADEPVSALDVSIQARIINLLQDLQKEYGITYLFIAHDLSVVKHICDRIAVMYLGKLVEVADTDELFDYSSHPYTKALISAIPRIEAEKRQEKIILEGDVPSPVDVPDGCRFHERCPESKDICKHKVPELDEIMDNHYSACHFAKEFVGGVKIS